MLDEFESLVDGRDYLSMHDERDYLGDGADSVGAECELERALGPAGYGSNKIVSKGHCAEFWCPSSGEVIEQEFVTSEGGRGFWRWCGLQKYADSDYLG